MRRPRLADHEHDLAFVVELVGFRRIHDRLEMADEAARRAHEDARVLRRFGAVLVLRVAVAVVDADADDLLGIRDRRQVADLVERDRGLARRAERDRAVQLAAAQDGAERRVLLAEQPAEVDDARRR